MELRYSRNGFRRDSNIVSWFTVITVIAFGQHYLNKPHPWLARINEGLYPFYILIRPPSSLLDTTYVNYRRVSDTTCWSVLILTLISCVILYLAIISLGRQ